MIVASGLRHRTILTYGSFDLFSQNHVRLLRDLSGKCAELIVGCATDGYCIDHAEPCAVPYAERRAVLEHCRFVARVIPFETLDQQHTDIVNYNVSALAVGPEWRGQLDGLRDIVKLLYLPHDAMPQAPVKLTQPVQKYAIY
ncbi:hypothetical protein [Sulfitobacter sp. JB4-11]|uniref:hypothetical protein n=1 Tax=Sulfitobacter rhodophyticola TaxID=3238304 RepID=UPI0035125569